MVAFVRCFISRLFISHMFCGSVFIQPDGTAVPVGLNVVKQASELAQQQRELDTANTGKVDFREQRVLLDPSITGVLQNRMANGNLCQVLQ